jgi:hypothetical protein
LSKGLAAIKAQPDPARVLGFMERNSRALLQL